MVRRGAVVAAVVVAVGVLGACKAPAWPGTPTPGPSPSTSPTGTPSAEPTGEPTTTPTTDPSDPSLPGGSDGVEVRVEIEPGYSMPNLVESSLKQARRTLEQQGATTVRVVDARRGDAVAGQANGWTVCGHEPAAGSFTLESVEVVLAAAPNARQCP
ncbi:hypothetical protein V5D56_01770 [Cellulosimicrobium sp. PMB13]|uniref:hypothetical protein n=1 Tax=Cellulosimicrobium sp. PMB13 TaxID=3120158 RepID=UPI003F4C3062